MSPPLYHDRYGGREPSYGPVHTPCTGDGGQPYDCDTCDRSLRKGFNVSHDTRARYKVM
jgi:hypothetical protein